MAVTRVRRVAFIGTGIMGAPIAGHILDAGYQLVVHNHTRAKAQPLLDRGATWADTPAQAARQADVTFTMVGYPNQVEDVYLGKDGILDAAGKGAWMVDLTTSSPQLAKELHDAADVTDKHFVDCPVTGGQTGAQEGTLTLMVGSTPAKVNPILPVLECFSNSIYYFGEPGSGMTAKLCNQVALAGCMVGYAEALGLAQQSGLDQRELIDLIMHGTGNSGALQSLAPKSVDGDFRPGFMNEHFRKDLALAIRQAEDQELTLPGTRNAFDLYDTLCSVGGSRLGTQAISLMYEDEETCVAAGLDWTLLDGQPQDDSQASAEEW
jgi:3-hydroxyisobutyrate dehydrogenase